MKINYHDYYDKFFGKSISFYLKIKTNICKKHKKN
jgi:hypothetical protein